MCFVLGGKILIIIILGAISDEEEDLINKIFSKMNKKMYNISYKKLESKADAEEAVAQTFLKIIKHIEKISKLPCPQIEPYCVVILKNEANNIIRQRKKETYAEDLDSSLYNNQIYEIEEEFIRSADKEKLLFCVNKLSDDEKNLIYLRYVNDMSFKEISGLLGITEEAAKKRSQRILKKLRLYYEGGYESVHNG